MKGSTTSRVSPDNSSRTLIWISYSPGAALRRENWGYDRHLRDGFLAPLLVDEAPAGTFRRWWQGRIDAGGQDAQIKPLHLCPDVNRAPTWEG